MRTYLVRLRENKGLSMRRLAREAGISFQYYSTIEDGEKGNKMSLIVTGKIAKVLDISLEAFYELEKEYQESLLSKYGNS